MLNQRVFGPEPDAGTVLVLLHGFLGSGDNWTMITRLLPDVPLMLALDLPYHGESPAKGHLSIAGMAAEVQSHLEEAWPKRRYTVLGHSLGGKIAMAMALQGMEGLDSILVEDIVPKTYPPEHLILMDAMASVDLKAIASRTDASRALESDIPNAAVRGFLLKNLVRDGEQWRWRIDLDLFRRHYDTLRGWDIGGSSSLACLLLSGSRSVYVRDGDPSMLQAQFPEMEHVRIDGATHWVHADKPQEFASAVSEYLGRIPRP